MRALVVSSLLLLCFVLAGCLTDPGASDADPPPLPPPQGGSGDTALGYSSRITSAVWYHWDADETPGASEDPQAGTAEWRGPRLRVGDRDRVRFEVENEAGGELRDFHVALLVPSAFRVVEGDTVNRGTLPVAGVRLEVVVEAVEPARSTIRGTMAWEGRDVSRPGDEVEHWVE
ncbi:MAG: hypothetical protein ACT4PT_10200 [Methanobacteriota archaeon]